MTLRSLFTPMAVAALAAALLGASPGTLADTGTARAQLQGNAPSLPHFQSSEIRPSTVDPTIAPAFDAPHLLILATNIPPLGRLLLHLPGTDSNPGAAEEWLKTAAGLGYHAIGLKYQNNPSIASRCSINLNLDCFRDIAEETVTGQLYPDSDPSAPKQVLRQDSIEVRLQNLLSYQATHAPASEHWDQFLDSNGQVRWGLVAVSGHSQGGSCALYVSKSRNVNRAILFSAVDWILFPTNHQPPWFAEPGITPPERIYGFTHRRDTVDKDTGLWQQQPVWEDLQLTQLGPLLLVESNSPPYQGSHTLTSLLVPGATNENGSPKYHNSVISTEALPRGPNGIPRWLPVWAYMLTNEPAARPVVHDFGDAPDTYSTTLAVNGPRHRILPGLRLGSRVDPELDGQPSPDARADDLNDTDDDDGLVLTRSLVRGTNAGVRLYVTAPPAGAFVDAFVDFNRDGDFADAGEKIFDRQPVHHGTNLLSFQIPAGASLGRTFARIRLSSAGGLGFDGPADDGEVEDHRTVILPAGTPPVGVNGLDVVPQGGAAARKLDDETIELSGMDDGSTVSLLVQDGAFARRSGRVTSQFDPPIELGTGAAAPNVAHLSLTVEQPYGDAGDGTTEHFSIIALVPGRGPEGNETALHFNEADSLVGSFRLASAGRQVRVCAFNTNLVHVATTFVEVSGLGALLGETAVTGFGVASSPASFWLLLDRATRFRTPAGQILEGRLFRFTLPEADDEVLVAFRSIEVSAPQVGNKTLRLRGARVTNAHAPVIHASGNPDSGSLQINADLEENVFYRIDNTSGIGRPWIQGTIYQFGRGGPAALPVILLDFDDEVAANARPAGWRGAAPAGLPGKGSPAARFFRLVAE